MYDEIFEFLVFFELIRRNRFEKQVGRRWAAVWDAFCFPLCIPPCPRLYLP